MRAGLELPRDNGLKLFLEKDDMERLYDFEEECVEGYFREQEVALYQSTDERIKSTNDRVENMTQKIEDINQKENLQSATVQVSFTSIFYYNYFECLFPFNILLRQIREIILICLAVFIYIFLFDKDK